MMTKYGEVRDVYIPTDHYTKRPRGFCFVEFFDGRDARDALENLDCTELDGRDIKVVFAKENRKTPDQMRRVQPPRQRRDSRDFDRRDRSRDRYDERDRYDDRDRRRSRSRDRRDRGRDRDRDGYRSRSRGEDRRRR
ncbi:Srsf10 [Symbiodinium microadriaticum]|nr:Srsf10 [Symbiodinium microadriaticum]